MRRYHQEERHACHALRCCLARREINLILCGGVAMRQRTGDTDHPIPIAVVAFQHRMNYTAMDTWTATPQRQRILSTEKN